MVVNHSLTMNKCSCHWIAIGYHWKSAINLLLIIHSSTVNQPLANMNQPSISSINQMVDPYFSVPLDAIGSSAAGQRLCWKPKTSRLEAELLGPPVQPCNRWRPVLVGCVTGGSALNLIISWIHSW